MTSAQYQEELDYILQQYVDDVHERYDIFNSWVKAQKFDDHDITFMISLAILRLQKRIDEVVIEDSILKPIDDSSHHVTKFSFHFSNLSDFEPYLGKFDEYCDLIYELIKDLEKCLTETCYPFENLKLDRAIVPPKNQAILKKAELWAIEHGFLTEAGTFNEDSKTNQQMAAFIGTLIDFEVIKYTKQDSMKSFCKMRYNADLGDQLKRSKLKINPDKSHGTFSTLYSILGIKV